jgi:hypothetical protein
MKTRSAIVRIGAIVCSLTLAGVYVSCRSVGTPDAQTSVALPAQQQHDSAMFSGTKSAPIELPKVPPAPPASQTLMPSSKSALIIDRPAQKQSAPRQPRP